MSKSDFIIPTTFFCFSSLQFFLGVFRSLQHHPYLSSLSSIQRRTIISGSLYSGKLIMGIYDASPYHALGDEESADEKRENSSEEPLLPAIRARIQHVRSLKPQFSCNVTASLLILCAFVSTILATVVTTRWLETRNNGLIKATSFYCGYIFYCRYEK